MNLVFLSILRSVKEAEAYQAAQMAIDQPVPSEVPEVANDIKMRDNKDGSGEKRKLEGDATEEAHKKVKTGQFSMFQDGAL
jgi:hypothetical protein